MTGVVFLMDDNTGSTIKVLMKVGAVLFLICWILLLPPGQRFPNRAVTRMLMAPGSATTPYLAT